MDTQGAYTAFRPVTLGFNRREAAETLHVGKAAAKSVTSMYYVRTYQCKLFAIVPISLVDPLPFCPSHSHYSPKAAWSEGCSSCHMIQTIETRVVTYFLWATPESTFTGCIEEKAVKSSHTATCVHSILYTDTAISTPNQLDVTLWQFCHTVRNLCTEVS